MGARTLTAIVTSGLSRAARSELTSFAKDELKDWLKDTYKSWPWPFLHKRSSGLSLVSGASSLAIGNGSGGITNGIITILDPVYIYTSDYSVRDIVRIRSIVGPDEMDLDLRDPATSRGRPTYFKVQPGATEGLMSLIPDKVADRDYLLRLNYTELPAVLGDSDIPIFPSDRIMTMVVEMAALNYAHKYDAAQMKGELIERELLKLKTYEGDSPGVNETLGLDGDTFQ